MATIYLNGQAQATKTPTVYLDGRPRQYDKPQKVPAPMEPTPLELTPVQQTLKKYSEGTFKGDELKQGIKELNNIARQNTYFAPKIEGEATQDEIRQAMELRDKLQRQTAGTAGAMGFFNAASLGLAKNAKPDVKQMYAEAQAAQPLAYGAGNAAGKMAQYAAVAPAMAQLPVVGKAAGAIGGGIGTGIAKLTGGKIAQQAAADVATRLAADTFLDLAVDTIPEAAGNIAQGKSAGEVAKEATKNLAVNIGFNMGAEGIGQLFKAIKAGKASKQAAEQAKQAIDTMDDAAKQAVAVESGFKNADEMAQAVNKAIVLDENGSPLKMYHGTNAEFEVFDKAKINSNEPAGDFVGKGFFFTPDKFKAQGYGNNVKEAFLNMGNPLVIETKKDLENLYNQFGGIVEYVKLKRSNPQAVQDKLKSLGYDGLIDKMYNQYAVFEPEQIIIPSQATKKITPDASVGAATSGFDPYSKAANEYGTIKPGENPARVVDVPVSMDNVTKNSRFARTAMEAKATPDEMIPLFEQHVTEGLFSYKPKKDKEALDAAVKSITNKGYDGALEQWGDIVKGNKIASKDDMVLGQMLYSVAAQNGDSETAMKLAAEIAAEGTRMGQGIQSLRMLKKTTPEGKLYYAQKSAEFIKNDLIKKYGANAPELKIEKGLVDNYMGAMKSGDQAALDVAMGAIEQNIADQIPATLADKWNAWRYFSMLGNPRTHIRNVVGNAMFYGTTKAKNGLAAALEEAVDKTNRAMGGSGIERTKALVKDPAAIEFAKKDVAEMMDVLQGGGKYNPSDAIRDKRTIFKTKWLETARKFNMDKLEAEDAFFLKPHFVDSMAGYISANKINPAKITAEQLEMARNYAIKEAQRATFRDASVVADGLNKLSKTHPAMNIIVEGIVPFKKTPVNIAKRALEYSPVGLATGTKQALLDVKSGKKTAAEAIDTLASGLTGSAIMALGWWMAQNGVLTAGRDDDTRQQQFDELQGEQSYALKIGDKSYTLDWAAPSAIPLFMGAEYFNRKQGEMSMQEFINSLLRVGDPLIEMSMLQGLESTLKTAAYSENVIADITANTIAGYASQGVPTLGGQIARSVDDTRRTTYVDKGDIKFASSAIQRAQAKIPGLSQNLTPRIDAWGQEVKQQGDNVLSRAAQNMLSPGYYSESDKTSVEKELERLYKKGVEDNPYPQIAPRFFNSDGKRIDLTAKEWEKYAKEKGRTSHQLVKDLIKNPYYKKMPDAGKAKAISDAYKYANTVAKKKVKPDYKLPNDWTAKAYEAQKNGISPSVYMTFRNTADADGNGSITQEEATAALNKLNLTERQRAYMYLLQNDKWKNNPYK